MAERGPAPPEWVVAPSEGWVAPKGLTPDGRVLASQGRRVLAYLIDYGIWVVPNAIIGVFLVATFVSSLSATDDLSGLNVPVVVGLYALLFVLGLVRLALEAEKLAHRGQTWGMQAMGLRAVDARNGGRSRGVGPGPARRSPCGSAPSCSASATGGPSSTTASEPCTTWSAPWSSSTSAEQLGGSTARLSGRVRRRRRLSR